MLLSWAMYIDGNLVVGNSPSITRVVNAYNMHKEDLTVVETYNTEPQNTEIEGDDDQVNEIVRKNLGMSEEPDELS